MADNAAAVEDDLSLPRAAVNKMIKEMIPMIRVSNDARELVLNCCTEFIHLIASEANEICNKQTKKTISPEHVIQALESLGFHDYVKDVEGVYQQFKKQAQTRKKNNKLKNQGVSEEELLRQQQALIAKARAEQAQEEWMHMQQHNFSIAAQQQSQQPLTGLQQQQLLQLGVPPQQMAAPQQMAVNSLTLPSGEAAQIPLSSPNCTPTLSPMAGNATLSVPIIPGSLHPGPNSLLQNVSSTCNLEVPNGSDNSLPTQDNLTNGTVLSNQSVENMETEENNTHTSIESIEVIASSVDIKLTSIEDKEDIPSNVENT